jgi:phosphoribosylformylglycinamidine (FGAM) synthase-like amidotransferase family enzyme
MKSAVVQLPGLNRDRDMIAALTKISGQAPVTIWQTETDIPDVDLIVIPGGFSYGDYLRCGAIAARMPVMQAIIEKANKGVKVLGVCNGFQILVEAGLLPGALMRNASLKFVCREIKLEVVNAETDFTRPTPRARSSAARSPTTTATTSPTPRRWRRSKATARWCSATPRAPIRTDRSTTSPVMNEERQCLGMMPHPENLIEAAHGGSDGRGLFASALDVIAA